VFRKRSPQGSLFGASHFLPEDKRNRLEVDWPGVFRRSALPLIDEEAFRGFYHDANGRPNKAVQTVVGVLVLKEIHDLTDAETVGEIDFDLRWHTALDLSPEEAHVCQKTLHNFRVKLMASDGAKVLFEETAAKIAEALGIDTSRQRLDSTHIVSNIAMLTRLRLFAETMRKFLRDLQGASKQKFEAVPGGLRARYLKDDGEDSSYDDARSSEGRRRLAVCARDVWRLLDRFRGDEAVRALESYSLLERVLEEQCEIVKEAATPAAGDADANESPVPVVLRDAKDVGSDSLQTPHDPDATYSGRKGKGYEVQLTETVGNGEKPEILTHVNVTRSCDSDAKATLPAVDDLARRGMAPTELAADTAFGSTENVIECAKRGVDLVAPVPGPEVKANEQAKKKSETSAEAGAKPDAGGEVKIPPKAETTTAAGEAKSETAAASPAAAVEKPARKTAFEIDPAGARAAKCPAGREATSEKRDAGSGKIRIVFAASTCAVCPFASRCPAKRRSDGSRVLRTTVHAAMVAKRRRYEATAEFRERYAERAGIEATASELKRAHGMDRLRVRRKARVRLAVFLKVTACNVKRMVKYLVAQAKRAAKAAASAAEAASEGASSCVVLTRAWTAFVEMARGSAILNRRRDRCGYTRQALAA